MSFDTAILAVENAIEVARKAGNRALGLEFFGGEPLLNWPVIEQVLDHFGTGRKTASPSSTASRPTPPR